MNKYPLGEYLFSGCEFANTGKQAFVFMWAATDGKVCDTGCAWFDGGKCAAYRKLTIPAKPAAQQEPQETVRETAARLGISISEVRRRRRQTA